MEQNQVPSNEPQGEVQQGAAKSYNPFIAPVNEKAYTQINVSAGQQQIAAPIPEPSFQANTVSSNENAYNMLNGEFSANGGAAPSGGGKPNAPYNPMMNGLASEETKMAAKEAAALTIDAYAMLKGFANKLLQFNEKKFRKLIAEGEIDPNLEIPYGADGSSITPLQFVQEFNEQNKDTLQVSKEFRKEILPPLTRIYEKRGIGATDEQLVMYYLVKDLSVSGVLVYQNRAIMSDFIESVKEATVAYREGGGQRPMTSPSTPPPPPPTPPSSGDEPPIPRRTPPPPPPPMDESDFNFRNNEVVVDSAVVKHVLPQSGKAALMKRKKRDQEIADAMRRAEGLTEGGSAKPSYKEMMAKKKSGQRGKRTTKDYITQVDEAEIAEAIVLNESKPIDNDKIEGLD